MKTGTSPAMGSINPEKCPLLNCEKDGSIIPAMEQDEIALPAPISIALILLFGTITIAKLVIDIQEASTAMYIHPVVFLFMLLGDALSIAGVLIGSIALLYAYISRFPRPPKTEDKIKILKPGE